MRLALIVCGLFLMAGIWGALASRHAPDHHGGAFQGFQDVSVRELLETPASFTRKDVRTAGTLTKQCPATGCWFFLKGADGKDLKVEMGDTVANLPPRLGKAATVEGQLVKIGDSYEFVGTAVEFE